MRYYSGDHDLYFEPNFVPLDIRARRLVTTVADFSCQLHPQWHPKARVDSFNRHFFSRIQRSDAIITISEHVAQEAAALPPLREKRIVTIYPGCRQNFHERREDAPDQPMDGGYMLFVGSIEPRKNILGLLQAYAQLPKGMRKTYKLLLVGFEGWRNEEIFSTIKRMKGEVDYFGYVTEEQLATLYRGAKCLIYPSFYEGFGLPPLEAMASGCPVVVSRVASLPEVCGDAAQYVDPYDVESIAHGIQVVLTDDALRQQMAERGLQRSRLFTWERSAAEHLRLFQEVVGT